MNTKIDNPSSLELDRRNFLKFGAAAGVSALATMQGTKGAFAQENVLRMLTEDTADVEVAWYQKVNQSFLEAHPGVDLQYQAMNTEAILQKITTGLAQNNPPDMVANWSQTRVAGMANLGLLDDMSDVVEAIGPDRYLSGYIDDFTFDGKVLGAPIQNNTFAYWYRTDIAAEVGAKEPTNWDELMTYAQKATRGSTYGIVLPAGNSGATSRKILEFIRQNGGNIIDEDLNVAIDSAINRETMAYMREIYRYSPAASLNYSFGDVLTNFVAGTAASCYYTGRAIQRTRDGSPENFKNMKGVTQPFSKQPYTYIEPRAAIIFKAARNRDMAKAWILEELFDPAKQIEWLLTSPGNSFSALSDVASDPRFTESPLIKERASDIEAMRPDTAVGGNFFRVSREHKQNFKGSLLDTGPILPTMLQRLLLDQDTPESALAWAQKEITDLYARTP